jgi:hypothetical protein
MIGGRAGGEIGGQAGRTGDRGMSGFSNAAGGSDRILLDPTSERAPARRERLPRLESLDGRRIGLLDISKPRGDLFLDRLEQRLRERGAQVTRFRKPTFTKPAPVDLRHEIAVNCDAVVEALAD